MKSRVMQVALIAAALAAFASGQGSGTPGTPGLPGGAGGKTTGGQDSGTDGFHLYDLSLFGGYTSSANPITSNVAPQPGTLGSDENYGASIDVGWQHHREKDNVGFNYSGTYSGMSHYTSANYYSQWVTIHADRKLAPKWHATLSGSAQDGTLLQVINQPSALSVISQLPQDVQDLAAALGLGGYSTDQAAAAILGAPVVATPLRSLLLGDKIQSFSGTAGISYSQSPTLNYYVNVFGSGGRNRSASEDGTQTVFVLPHSYGAEAGMSWTFSRTPRTELALNLDANRLQNSYQQAMTGLATASIGRRMGERWFARMYAGGTYTDSIQQLSGSPKTQQVVGGASLGFKTRSQTFAGTYDRSVSDTYGAFIGTYTTLSGSWRWHRPGGRVEIFASGGQQQVRNTGFESFSGWQAAGGFTEHLSHTMTLSAQYVYFKSTGVFQQHPTDFSVNSVRMTIGWSPEAVAR